MKKLSLLVALGLFTLGSATMVKAQGGADSVIIDSPDATVEVDPLDLNQDGVVDEEEAAKATEEAPAPEEAANLEDEVIPVKDAPTDAAPKENLKQELKQDDPSTTDADGDGVTADQDQDDNDATVGAAE